MKFYLPLFLMLGSVGCIYLFWHYLIPFLETWNQTDPLTKTFLVWASGLAFLISVSIWLYRKKKHILTQWNKDPIDKYLNE